MRWKGDLNRYFKRKFIVSLFAACHKTTDGYFGFMFIFPIGRQEARNINGG